MEAVLAALRASGARTVLDLGCGSGALLIRLAREPTIRNVVGVDVSREALRAAERRLREDAGEITASVSLIHGSFAQADERLVGFEAATMVETIEHIDPDRLSSVERAVFGCFRPETVIVTTPNREFNDLLGVPKGRLRHPDHRFEWDRARFRSWAGGVADRNGYCIAVQGIGGGRLSFGGPTQMALFRRFDRCVHQH